MPHVHGYLAERPEVRKVRIRTPMGLKQVGLLDQPARHIEGKPVRRVNEDGVDAALLRRHRNVPSLRCRKF